MKEIRKCNLCHKPMMNSLHSVTIAGELEMWVHLHCEKEIGCRTCIRMILENINGKCICGRQIIDGRCEK